MQLGLRTTGSFEGWVFQKIPTYLLCVHPFAHNIPYLELSSALISAQLIPLYPLGFGLDDTNSPRELSHTPSLRLCLVHFLWAPITQSAYL